MNLQLIQFHISKVQYSSTVCQWDIFDAYMVDYKKQLLDEETNKTTEKRRMSGITLGVIEDKDKDKGKNQKEQDMVHSRSMNKALGILERIVNQNAEDEIFQDFRFWDDVRAFLSLLFCDLFWYIHFLFMIDVYLDSINNAVSL